EVVQDRLVRELLDDARPGPAADEAGRDNGHAEQLERPGHVDALPAGERDARARAVTLPALEVRHGQRPVDGRVESNGDDHADLRKVRRGCAGSCRRTTLDVKPTPVC